MTQIEHNATPAQASLEQSDPTEGLRQRLQPGLFRALADPSRLQVLFRLACAQGPQTVTEVAGCCGVHLSGVSRHLAALRDAEVVQAVKHGREVRYAFDPERLTGVLRGLADAFDACAEVAPEDATCDPDSSGQDPCCGEPTTSNEDPSESNQR